VRQNYGVVERFIPLACNVSSPVIDMLGVGNNDGTPCVNTTAVWDKATMWMRNK